MDDYGELIQGIQATRDTMGCLKKKIDEYGEEIQQMEELLKERMHAKSHYKEMKKDISVEQENALWALKEEIDKNKVQMDELMAKYQEVDHLLDQKLKSARCLEEEVTRKKQLMNQVKAQTCASEREANDIRKQMAAVREEKHLMEKQMRCLKDDFSLAQQELERARTRRAELQTELETTRCQAERKQKEHELKFMKEKERCECLTAKLQQMEEKIIQCEEKLECMRQVDRENSNLIELKRREMERLQQQIASDDSEDCYVKEQICMLNRKLEGPRKELQIYQDKVSQLKSEICQLDYKNAELRKVLDTYIADLKAIKDCSGKQLEQEKCLSNAIAMDLEQFVLRLASVDEELADKREILQQKLNRLRMENARLRYLKSEFNVVKNEYEMAKDKQKCAQEERQKAEEYLNCLEKDQTKMKQKVCDFRKELSQLEEESHTYEMNSRRSTTEMERHLMDEKCKTQHLISQYENIKLELEMVYRDGKPSEKVDPSTVKQTLNASKALVRKMEDRISDLTEELRHT